MQIPVVRFASVSGTRQSDVDDRHRLFLSVRHPMDPLDWASYSALFYQCTNASNDLYTIYMKQWNLMDEILDTHIKGG